MRWAGWKPGGLHAGGFSTILPLCWGGLPVPAPGAVGLEASLPTGVSGGSSGCFWVLPQFGARWLSALGAAFWSRVVPRGDCSGGRPVWGSSPGGLGGNAGASPAPEPHRDGRRWEVPEMSPFPPRNGAAGAGWALGRDPSGGAGAVVGFCRGGGCGCPAVLPLAPRQPDPTPSSLGSDFGGPSLSFTP